jgi:hypothetical protein
MEAVAVFHSVRMRQQSEACARRPPTPRRSSRQHAAASQSQATSARARQNSSRPNRSPARTHRGTSSRRQPPMAIPIVPMAALTERAANIGVGIDTYRELSNLQFREVSPEDYNLLSRLHAKANAPGTFTREEIDDALPVLTLRVAVRSAGSEPPLAPKLPVAPKLLSGSKSLTAHRSVRRLHVRAGRRRLGSDASLRRKTRLPCGVHRGVAHELVDLLPGR